MRDNRIKLRLVIWASILCSPLTITLPAFAEEAVVGRVFIVGDSLSDGGAYSEVARSIGLPTSTYYKPVNNKLDGSARTAAEHFGESNGFTFVPNIVNDEVTITGVGISPYEDGGFNFAQSGARVELPNPQVAAISPLYTAKSFVDQIPDVIGAAGGRFNDNDVITLTIGANDFFNADPDPAVAAANLQIAAARAAEGVRQFIDAGAKNIIVFNLPDAKNVPLMQDIAAADPANSAIILDTFSQLSNLYTSSLERELANTRAVVFDLARVTQFIVDDPTRYGFDVGLVAQDGDGDLDGTACQGGPVSGVSLLCLEGVNTTSDPDLTYVFADGVHPTSEAHFVIAQALQGLFDGAVETARMLEALQESQRLADAWRSDRLRPSALSYLDENGNVQIRSSGDFRLTSNANYSSADTDSESIFGGADSGQLLGSLAIDFALAENLLIGGEINVGGGDIDLGSIDADWSSYGLGMYGMSLISNGFYVNAAAGISVIDFNSFDRTIKLGRSVETYTADPKARRTYAQAGAGFAWKITDEVTLTTEAAYAYDLLKMEDFSESLGAASVAFGENEIESRRAIGSMTMDAVFKSLPGWSFSVKGAYEYELEDDRHEIKIGSDSNSLGELSFERFDGSYGVVSGKISKAIGKGVLSLSMGVTLPENGETDFIGSLGFGIGF